MDERGRRRLAVGAGDADDFVRRKLGPGAGEQLDVADDLDAGLAGALGDGVAVEREARCDDEAVELAEVRFVEDWRARSRLGAFALASSFESQPVTRAPLASNASAVASPDRARP